MTVLWLLNCKSSIQNAQKTELCYFLGDCFISLSIKPLHLFIPFSVNVLSFHCWSITMPDDRWLTPKTRKILNCEACLSPRVLRRVCGPVSPSTPLGGKCRWKREDTKLDEMEAVVVVAAAAVKNLALVNCIDSYPGSTVYYVPAMSSWEDHHFTLSIKWG